jgi:hypothetical protein
MMTLGVFFQARVQSEVKVTTSFSTSAGFAARMTQKLGFHFDGSSFSPIGEDGGIQLTPSGEADFSSPKPNCSGHLGFHVFPELDFGLDSSWAWAAAALKYGANIKTKQNFELQALPPYSPIMTLYVFPNLLQPLSSAAITRPTAKLEVSKPSSSVMAIIVSCCTLLRSILAFTFKNTVQHLQKHRSPS